LEFVVVSRETAAGVVVAVAVPAISIIEKLLF